MANVRALKTRKHTRVAQGDIIRDIECIEYVVEKDDIVEVSKIVFPLVIVLTQDCDLEQDFSLKKQLTQSSESHDKLLFSVLIAPLYNADAAFAGDHLTELKMKMQRINSDRKRVVKNNEVPRYHYLDLGEKIAVPPQVIDFKHFFSVNLLYLEKRKKAQFVCHIGDLFREDISQRFSSYLSRIGLPNLS